MTPTMTGGYAAAAATPTPHSSQTLRCCSASGPRSAATNACRRTPRTPSGHTVAPSAAPAQRAPSACLRRCVPNDRGAFSMSRAGSEKPCASSPTTAGMPRASTPTRRPPGSIAMPASAPQSASSSRSRRRAATISFTSRTQSISSPTRWSLSAACAPGSRQVACSASCSRTSWRAPMPVCRATPTRSFRPARRCAMRLRWPVSRWY